MRLGSYEIVGLLGAGGMGEVYRARDTRLNRDVALKVLPEAFTADADRIARFRREAQVLATLNHPNIAAIHGLEESGGVLALVLELVDGPTLADRIAQGSSMSPTITSPAMMTGAGMVLGTAAYMAPEQAKGRPADRRSDIWAISSVPGAKPHWAADGRTLFYASGQTLMSIAIQGTTPADWGTPEKLFEGPYVLSSPGQSFDIAPDGRFLMVKEDGDTGARAPDTMIIVQNWVEELRARVPR